MKATKRKKARSEGLGDRHAGIERCSPNDLRRTFATWMRADGVPPNLIGSMMGHADSRMVERVYARLGIEALGAAVAQALGLPAPAVGAETTEPKDCIAGASDTAIQAGLAGLSTASWPRGSTGLREKLAAASPYRHLYSEEPRFFSSPPGRSLTEGIFMMSVRPTFQAFWTIHESDRS
jgi:hypothetical protein